MCAGILCLLEGWVTKSDGCAGSFPFSSGLNSAWRATVRQTSHTFWWGPVDKMWAPRTGIDGYPLHFLPCRTPIHAGCFYPPVRRTTQLCFRIAHFYLVQCNICCFAARWDLCVRACCTASFAHLQFCAIQSLWFAACCQPPQVTLQMRSLEQVDAPWLWGSPSGRGSAGSIVVQAAAAACMRGSSADGRSARGATQGSCRHGYRRSAGSNRILSSR